MIYVIIPVHNRRELTRKCLDSLSMQSYRDFNVVVVDDGSMNGTSIMIEKCFPEVKIIKGDGNLWWTGAINVGIRYTMKIAEQKDYILVLNDDLIVNYDYLEKLLLLAKEKKNALIGSVTTDINNPTVIDNGGSYINWITAKCVKLNNKQKLFSFPENYYQKVSTLTGRGTLIPVRVFKEIGLYNDKHLKQCGDTELPLRAKKAGYELFISYSAIVKSHLKSSDQINISNKYKIKDLIQYYFGMRSHMRLKYRFYFALSAKKNPFQFICFLLFDFIRITFHFICRLKLSS